MNRSHRAMRIVSTAVLLPLLLCVTRSAAADVTREGRREAPIAWEACTEENLIGFQCASVPVPLDYRKPDRAKVFLALARRAADDPGRRIGTLFVHTGGPGSGVRRFLTIADTRLGPEVLSRFDVLAMDSRGTGASTVVQCFDTDEAYLAVRGGIEGAPRTAPEISAARVSAKRYGDACARRVGRLLEHVGTPNVVRDLELLRKRVGDTRFNFLGFSYGTFVGAMYAARYPEKVRALVLDGNVDPNNRANNRLLNNFERTGGFELALGAFLDACEAAGPDCAFSGNAHLKYATLLETLRRGPIETPNGPVSFHSVTSALASRLYSLARFPAAAEALQAAYLAAYPAGEPGGLPVDRKAASSLGAAVATAYSYSSTDALYAINCIDAPLPRRPAAFTQYANQFEAAHSSFGRFMIYAELPCATWPVVLEDRYTGPWMNRAAAPALIINTTYDPPTPYLFAQRMRQQLVHARLLTLDGFGHCSQASQCVRDLQTRYLIDLELPPEGTRCAQDLPPFPPRAQVARSAAVVPLGTISPAEPPPGVP